MSGNLRNLFPLRLSRSASAIVFMLLLAQPGQATDTPLSLFKNYFVTGGNASAGKGMRGTGQLDPATGLSLTKCPGDVKGCTISVDVPPGADIVAAFLYWETLEKTKDPSSAQGYLLDPNPSLQNPPGVQYPVAFFGRPRGNDHAAPCWSSGGSTGSSNGAPTLRVYRADVLRYLKLSTTTFQKVPIVTVQLQDSGSKGGTTPLTEGASLLVVYRRSDLPFRGIVIFDGSRTLNNDTGSLNQTVNGFYQTSATPDAKLTYIIGDGQLNFSERLFFDGDPTDNVPATLLATNPFTGTAGFSWDDLTFPSIQYPNQLNVPANASSVTTTLTRTTSGSFDCLSEAAIVFSANVLDSDEDGLLDVWETDGFKDPTTAAVLVNLPAMGADPCKKDLYIEIDLMQEFLDDSDGTHHQHKPKKDALDMVGFAFKNAPVHNPKRSLTDPKKCDPSGTPVPDGINVHFDVGNILDGETTAPYPDPFIIPATVSGREGGDIFNERSRASYCTSFSLDNCLFPNQPGLLSWKLGLRFIKESLVPADPQNLSSPPLTPNKHYFSSDARDAIFRYVLFAHALAIKALDDTGQPIHWPGPNDLGFLAGSISGRADLPGSDAVVTLGRWHSNTPGDAQVGSKNLQAATLLHEVAHTLWGYHGGTLNGLNCKPNQQSSLNYLYQSAGLLDLAGKFNVNLSGQELKAPPATVSSPGAEDEIALDEVTGLGPDFGSSGQTKLPYRLRWYALESAVETRLKLPSGTITPATRHCNGTVLGTAGNPYNLVRVDGFDVFRKPVDWNYDGTISQTRLPFPCSSSVTGFCPDINFNGAAETTDKFDGVNDWAHIIQYHGLQQLDSRRSVFGLSLGVGADDLLRLGEAATGQQDPLGEAATGEAGTGEAATGEAATGEAAPGEAGTREAATGEAATGEAATGDIDEKMALAVGNAPSNLLANRTNQGVNLSWDPPIGVVTQYTISRTTVDTGVVTLFVLSGTPPFTPPLGAPPATSFSDNSAKNSEAYLYFVIAKIDNGDGTQSQSNNSPVLFVPK